jgi:hypothetical protein
MQMKLNDERLQWILDNLEEFKRAIVTVDFCKKHRVSGYEDKTFGMADDIVHSLALSFLLVAMGEHIPKEMWTVDDFSELYTVLDDNRDGLNLRDYG